jgi:RNA recognition motif-containing protein
MHLYVSNLGDQITDESLGAIFATHGKVISARVIKDGFDGYSRGFAFVDMPNDQEAQKAIEKLDGMVVNGRSVSVMEAKAKGEQRNAFI